MERYCIARAEARFIQDVSHNAGLMIGAYPTGIGKSFQTCFMMLNLSQDKFGYKFIYATEQIKNVEQTRKDLYELGGAEYGYSDEEMKEVVLVLQSNIASFSTNYKEDEMKAPIERFFRTRGLDLQAFRNVVTSMKVYNRLINSDLAKYPEEEFRKCEEIFRKEIHKGLKNLESSKERLKLIRSDKDCRWIESLYPAVRINECKILLLSMKKLYYTIDPIITAPFIIWSETDLRINADGKASSYLKSHVLVIDEFDATKNTILDSIVGDNDKEIDAVREFRNLYPKIGRWRSLPKVMVTEKERWSEVMRHSLESRFKKLIDNGKRIRERYHIEYLFKLVHEDDFGVYEEPQASSFMFRDYEPFTVGNAVALNTDDEHRYNYVLTKKIPLSKRNKMSILFEMIYRYFDQFSKLVRDLAFNQMMAADPGDRKPLNSYVMSIVDAFDLDQTFARFILNKVIHNRLKSSEEKELGLLNATFYDKGFSYISMRDSPDASFQTHLYYTEYDTTPELVMRHICTQTKVIGLSATGEIDSPISNYSLSYLRNSGVYIHEISDDEREEMSELVNLNKQGFIQHRAQFDVEILPTDSEYSQDCWETMFGNDLDADVVYNSISESKMDYEDDSSPNLRYVRAAYAIDRFLRDDTLQSMLCYFSAHAKKEKHSKFSTSNLEIIITVIANKTDAKVLLRWNGDKEEKILGKNNGSRTVHIIQVTSSNLKEVDATIQDLLSKGEKVFIITSYKTLAAGQNLQYPIPEKVKDELVWVRGREPDSEKDVKKDYDAIYLDDPKSLAPMIQYSEKKSLDKYLFYAEFVDDSAQIRIEDKRASVGKAFRKYYSIDNKIQPSHFKKTHIYRLAKAQTILQAVGRMERTGWKVPRTLIMLDPELVRSDTFSLDRHEYGSFYSPEFDAIYESAHKMPKEEEEQSYELLESAAVRTSHNFVEQLNGLRFAVYGGSTEHIETWEKLRDFALCNPTGPADISTADTFEAKVYRYGYIKLPQESNMLWFTQRYDFESDSTDGLEIRFNKPTEMLPRNNEKQWQELSSGRAKLEQILQIPYVREEFVKRGYATTFSKNGRIMSPPLFRNVYMGALGEFAGRVILEKECNLKLENMEPRYYEQFDFRTGTETFYDAKDWNSDICNSSDAVERLKKKIFSKLELCKGKRAYVFNIIDDGSVKYQERIVYRSKDGDKEIIVFPYLFIVRNGVLEPNASAFSTFEMEANQ